MRQYNIIKAYFRAFINYEQDNWAQLLPMTKFAYNHQKNASTNYTTFEFNCRYHPQVFYKKTSILASNQNQ